MPNGPANSLSGQLERNCPARLDPRLCGSNLGNRDKLAGPLGLGNSSMVLTLWLWFRHPQHNRNVRTRQHRLPEFLGGGLERLKIADNRTTPYSDTGKVIANGVGTSLDPCFFRVFVSSGPVTALFRPFPLSKGG